MIMFAIACMIFSICDMDSFFEEFTNESIENCFSVLEVQTDALSVYDLAYL